MKASTGKRVSFHYELLDAEGARVEGTEADDPVSYVHGQEEILPALERALEGVGPGEEREITLPPEEAYGPYDAEGLILIPRSDLPGDELEPGDWVSIHLEHGDGAPEPGDDGEEGEFEARIVEVRTEGVLLDANHPLAGQSVTFRLRVLSVEKA